MEKTKSSRFQKFIKLIESLCNKIPQPGILFMYLFVITAVLSLILSKFNVLVINPTTNSELYVKNFFSVDGLYWFLGKMISNFTSFPPLGLVLVMTAAVGLCEESGLIVTLLNEKMKHIFPALLPYVVAFVGILGNIASDTAVIVIPSLAGLLYLAAGKHPVAGMICGYAATEAGFTANIMVAGTDGLLQAITQRTADDFLGEGVLSIDITCNWYFMIASTFLCTLVIGFMCSHFVDKYFGEYVPIKNLKKQSEKNASPLEKKALSWAGISMLVYILLVACITIWGPLGVVVGHESDGKRAFIGSYFLKYLVVILVFFFSVPGIVYGLITGSFKKLDGINHALIRIMGRMGNYLVFCFFCAQFQSLFSWSNIDKILAINGAKLLNAADFTGYGLIIAFILFSSIINFFIPSASAKWAILAPVFIPMMILAGEYHPAMTQLFYRLGDSMSNCITPFSPYIWVTLKAAQDFYDPKLKLGTLISNMIPIGIVISVVWIVFLIVWMVAGLPIGPAVPIFMSAK